MIIYSNTSYFSSLNNWGLPPKVSHNSHSNLQCSSIIYSCQLNHIPWPASAWIISLPQLRLSRYKLVIHTPGSQKKFIFWVMRIYSSVLNNICFQLLRLGSYQLEPAVSLLLFRLFYWWNRYKAYKRRFSSFIIRAVKIEGRSEELE